MEQEIILEQPDQPTGAEVTPAEACQAGPCEPPPIEAAQAELPPERQYCIFRAGRDRYCMSVLDIEEVVEWPRLTPVPLAPSFLAGIFNLRGAIVPVVDVAFGQGKRSESLLRRVVVGFLPSAEGHGIVRIGIAADEVIGTCTTTEPLIAEGAPSDLPHCCGLLQVGAHLALALDLKRVVELFPVGVI